MDVDDFLIPSLRREFGDWPAPSVGTDAGDLLASVGVGAARDLKSGLSELLSGLCESLEQALILLSLCGHPATRLLIAAEGTPVAVSLRFDDMQVTSVDRLDWPAPITDELARGTAFGLELSDRPLRAVPLTRPREGWFVVGVPTAGPALDLANLRGKLELALPAVHEELLNDVAGVANTASVEELAGSSDLASGLLTVFDPAGWFMGLPSDPDDDALAVGDADAVKLNDLGKAMASRIDARGSIRAFLQEEIVRDRATRMPLRDRFHDDRADRQVLRGGMRGARRRHHEIDRDGMRRAFRLGRTRTLTYTEILIGWHLEGVVDVLHRINLRDLAPRWEFEGNVYGEVGQQYVIARLQRHEVIELIELLLVNPPSAPGQLSVSYRRWGHEHDVAGDVDPALLSLATGRLPRSLNVVDGEHDTPTLTVARHDPLGEPNPDDPWMGGGDGIESLRISGVQHGDVLVFTDATSGATAEVAIVKNFSRNDLNRLHAAGFELSLTQPFGGLAGLPDMLLGTIAFLLADGPATPQEVQRRALAVALKNTYPQAHSDPRKAYPATLDIPSSRGIGVLPDDASHAHLCAPTFPAEVTAAANSYLTDLSAAAGAIALPDSKPHHESPRLRADIGGLREVTKGALASVIDRLVKTSGSAAIWHTYETRNAALPLYLLPGTMLQLWSGDPVRNIRTDRGGAPRLFNVLALSVALDGIPEQGLSSPLQVGLFVNRRAEVELYVKPDVATGIGDAYDQVLQVADALASLADGGLVPPGVFVPGTSGGEDGPAPTDGDEPQPPAEEPTDTETHLGSVLLRVVDDVGSPLPLARVTISGQASLTVKTGNDGTVLINDQITGRYRANNIHYPQHEPETVRYDVVPETTMEVDLVLDRIPPDPGLPPLRGRIAEVCGFFVRETPGGNGQKLGKLHYHALDVTVLEAREIRKEGVPIKDLWYLVRFTPDDFHSVVVEYESVLNSEGDAEAIARHAALVEAHQGTEAWVLIDAMAMLAMPWDLFLTLLADFETTNANDDLLTRLSRVRQIGEESDVPANDVVGAGAQIHPQVNLDDRPHDPDRWQLLYEAKQVELPDGEVVDIHHFLLGVDGRVNDGRRSDDRTIFAFGVYPLPMGESYAALTWSGDVAAGATGMVRHEYRDWEEAALVVQPGAGGRTEEETIRLYLGMSAPDFDLLADVDSWGASDLMPVGDTPSPEFAVDSLVELVTTAYGPPGPLSDAHLLARSMNRANGIHAILTHYGFTGTTGLPAQSQPVARMVEQVKIIAQTYFQFKAGLDLGGGDFSGGLPEPTAEESQALDDLSTTMTALFLTWLQDLANPPEAGP